MKPHKIATAATMAAAGVVIGTAASADSPAPDLDAFKDKYRCYDISPHNWSPGADLLAKRHGVKTTLYVVPGERTVMIRRGSNKAEASAVAAYGSLRLVCERRVPWSKKPELGS